jgi:DNA-binding HxlR family transcriptional regulator
MKRKSYAEMTCPIARSLEHVGDWWNILILRDAAYGLTRFDHFQKSLGIATAMLSRRLEQLVKSGLLEKRQYQNNPPRYEYLLTESGQLFREVLAVFTLWGNRQFAPEGASVVVSDRRTGKAADLALIDRATGREVGARDLTFASGPAASKDTQLSMALVAGELTGDEFIERITALRFGPKRRAKEAR